MLSMGVMIRHFEELCPIRSKMHVILFQRCMSYCFKEACRIVSKMHVVLVQRCMSYWFKDACRIVSKMHVILFQRCMSYCFKDACHIGSKFHVILASWHSESRIWSESESHFYHTIFGIIFHSLWLAIVTCYRDSILWLVVVINFCDWFLWVVPFFVIYLIMLDKRVSLVVKFSALPSESSDMIKLDKRFDHRHLLKSSSSSESSSLEWFFDASHFFFPAAYEYESFSRCSIEWFSFL